MKAPGSMDMATYIGFWGLIGLAILTTAVPAAADDLSSSPSSATETQTCVDVRIGEDRTAYLNCINAQLNRDVARQQQVPQPAAPIDTHSATNTIGIVDETAARQKMGDAFGRSAQPQRPERVYVSPLLSH